MSAAHTPGPCGQIAIQEEIAGKIEAVHLLPPGRRYMHAARITRIRIAGRAKFVALGYSEPQARQLVQDADDMAYLRGVVCA